MYSEKQHFQHRYLAWLQWLSIAVIIWQIIAFVALEAGISLMPFSAAVHMALLLGAAAIWLVLANGHFSLRISTRGWDLRYFPFQWYPRHIAWEEIKNVSLIRKSDLPENAPFGFPGRDFTRSYLLTSPRYATLRIDLVTGGQIFLSSKNADELLGFLQKGVFIRGFKGV